MQLRLLGTFDEYELLEVTPDGEGNFSAELEIPADTRPGATIGLRAIRIVRARASRTDGPLGSRPAGRGPAGPG